MTDSEPAADHLDAALEPRRERPLRRAARWVAALVYAASGDPQIDPVADLVVRRRDTGAEVLRTPADVGDPERLLAQARDDLRTYSVQQFLAEWRA